MITIVTVTNNHVLTFSHAEEAEKFPVPAIMRVFVDSILPFPILGAGDVLEYWRLAKFLLLQEVQVVITSGKLPVLPVHHQIVDLGEWRLEIFCQQLSVKCAPRRSRAAFPR